jgi:hypothetical protein
MYGSIFDCDNAQLCDTAQLLDRGPRARSERRSASFLCKKIFFENFFNFSKILKYLKKS